MKIIKSVFTSERTMLEYMIYALFEVQYWKEDRIL